MNSGYPYSPYHNNRNSNTASTPNQNSSNNSPWGDDDYFGGRREGNGSLTLPPISRTNSGSRLELPGLSSSPLFIPETHTRQVQQPEPSFQRSMGNGNAIANTNTNTTASTSTSTSASTFASNPEPDQSHIKRPRSESPDLFSFDPFDESNRYRSPPPPLLSPQQAARQNSRISPQPARGSSFYDDDAEGLEDIDWDSFLSQGADDFDDPFASPPRPSHMPNRASNTYSVVDLTESSPPVMAPPTERRRALSGTSIRPATLTRPKSPKRKKPIAGGSRSTKRRKVSPSETKPEEDVEIVDLAENANLQEYEAAKQATETKRQEELIKKQNQDEATRPVKLAAFQCIICMDSPTDLTVTHCGKFSLRSFSSISNPV